MAFDRAWLRQQIQFFTHDTSLSEAVLDGFIDVAVVKIGQMLESSENEFDVPVSLTTQSSTLPMDIVSLRNVLWSDPEGGYALRSVPTHQINLYQSNGRPQVYSVRGMTLQVAPFQQGSYTLGYYGVPTIDAAPGATNPSLTAYPFIFRDAALSEAYQYKQDLEQVMRHDAMWLNQVDQVNRASQKLRQGDAPAMRAV